jgi:hypothetical protein
LLGIGLAISGTLLIVFFSDSESKVLTPDAILLAFGRIQTLAFAIATTVLIAVCTVIARKFKIVAVDIALVALYGGYTVISTKALSSMLTGAINKVFTSWLTYVTIIVLVTTAIVQVKYLNVALQRYDSTIVLPVQFVLFNLSVIAGSVIVFDDFQDLSPLQMAFFSAGCMLNFIGIYLIASNREPLPNEVASVSDSQDLIRLLGNSPISSPVNIYHSFMDPVAIRNDHIDFLSPLPSPLVRRGLNTAFHAIETIGGAVGQRYSSALSFQVLSEEPIRSRSNSKNRDYKDFL